MALTRQKIKNLAIYFSYIFIIALTSAGVSYFVSDSLKTDKRFGTVTSTGNFPTSLNNFQDDDIINSGDWNHIEYAIGETGTTSPATLTYQVVNTNANNVNYTGKLTITSSTTTNATITNLWTTSFSPTTLTATNGTVTNASTTYATLPTFWSTVGQITNASTTYLSMTDGWLADNPIVSKVAGDSTQLAVFSGTNTIVASSTIGLSFIAGLGTIAGQNSNNVSITGGSITGITDLTVSDGGTGASTLSGFLYGNGTSAITGTTTPYFASGLYTGSSITINGNTNDGFIYPAFSYATSTAWAGTTTIYLGSAFTAETWNSVQCFTDAGTLTGVFSDGTNQMNFFSASTTVGTVSLTTNNSFTTAEKRQVQFGTPASSPTNISCTIKKHY